MTKGARARAPTFAAVTLALWACACGGCGSRTRPSTGAAATTATTSSITMTSPDVIPPGQPVRGDADSDNPRDPDGSPDVDTTDEDDDSSPPQSFRYPDPDDAATFAYGHAGGARDRSEIAAVVGRYFADAARGDGATACTLLVPTLAAEVPREFGSATGPAYTRGTTTCATTLSKLFTHEGWLLAKVAHVLSVRIDGRDAQAIVGSRRMPASSIMLQRVGGSWQLQELLGRPLP